MKKLYIAPEVEIKRFNTEDIMAASGIDAGSAGEVDNSAYESATEGAKQTVSYNDLFTL